MNEKLIVEAMNAVDRLSSFVARAARLGDGVGDDVQAGVARGEAITITPTSAADLLRQLEPFKLKANYIQFLLDQARNTGKLERDYLLSAIADAHKMLEAIGKNSL